MSPSPAAPQPSPPRRWSLVVLTLLSALSAISGGLALVVWASSDDFVPLEVLEPTVFETFLVPGLVLMGVVGGTSLVAAIAELRRAAAAAELSLLAGGTLTVWIAAEVAMMRGFHWLQGLYGVLGLAILSLAAAACLRSGRLRPRWTVLVTAGEAVGYLAPATAGVLATRAGLTEGQQALAVVLAGPIEGLLLGLGQAFALPLPIRRLRYALWTALGAGVVWASVMSTMVLAGGEATPSPAVLVPLGIAVGAIGLVAIGGAQWLELRHHTAGAGRWIAWTALAWVIALPLSFTPGPFVDETTPLAANLVLWVCGGVLMAYAMALCTWQGARRLPAVADALRTSAPAPDPAPASSDA
ncbi:MAG: hypothetical protein KDK70_01035 [Myxococcales bacterium]|nr:hypothetical protein [Myxococcales bacterium]